MKAYSRGSVTLSDSDPGSSPRVQLNLLADRRDEERLIGGLRFALELLEDPAVAKMHRELFMPAARFVAAARDFVAMHAQPQFHVCGTCRMGSDHDREAVVDSDGRVSGIDALRVVDASIFPTVPRGYIHFIVLMAAEKLADAVKSRSGISDTSRNHYQGAGA